MVCMFSIKRTLLITGYTYCVEAKNEPVVIRRSASGKLNGTTLMTLKLISDSATN